MGKARMTLGRMTWEQQKAAMKTHPVGGPFPPLRESDDVTESIGDMDWTALANELQRLRNWRAELLQLVVEQAEDEALWAQAEFISEAYIQQELRRLTAAIERAA